MTLEFDPNVDREIFLNQWDIDTLADFLKALLAGTEKEWMADPENGSELLYILNRIKEQGGYND